VTARKERNMANIQVRNLKNEPLHEIELVSDVFEAPWNEHVVWEVVKSYLAGLRAGTHDTKTRSEVAGSGKKLWKQKHTGRARMGSARSPIWRKGGTVHGPHPHEYGGKVNIKTKKVALRSVLAKKAADQRIVVVDLLEVRPDATAEAKGRKRLTQQLATALGLLGVKGKALLVDCHGNDGLALAARNQPKVRLTEAKNVNAYDVLDADWLVLSEPALAKVTEVLR
jgi:large subunit ribosomal protein L4